MGCDRLTSSETQATLNNNNNNKELPLHPRFILANPSTVEPEVLLNYFKVLALSFFFFPS
jgi:hypothetical protein